MRRIVNASDLPDLSMCAVRKHVPHLVPRAACYLAARDGAIEDNDDASIERALRMLDALLVRTQGQGISS